MLRKLLVLVLLTGCASEPSQPQQPTETQRALISYYTQKCRAQGIGDADPQAMRACILINYRKDLAAASGPDCVAYPTIGGATGITCR